MTITINNDVLTTITDSELDVLSQTSYQVVTTEGWSNLSFNELAAQHEITGFKNASHLCHELQGKPMIEGYHGPMYNGVNEKGQLVVRYETYAAYDMYSR